MMPSLTDLLVGLLDANVDFVLVGGLAAVAQGAPVTTFDVDIVHRRTEENVDRLLAFLGSVDAIVREPTDRKLKPARAALLGPGHSLLTTSLGPLDCLGTIEEGRDFDSLVEQVHTVELDGRELKVLALEVLAELKASWDDDESKLRASLLRGTLKST